MARDPGFRQGRRRARSVIKCQRSAGPAYWTREEYHYNGRVVVQMRKRSSGRAQGRKQLGLKLRGTQGRKGAGAQAVGRKLPDHGSWTKYHGSRLVGLNQDERVGGVFDMEANLVW